MMAAIVQQQYPSVAWWCPQLPPSPSQAMRQVLEKISSWPTSARFDSMAVVGSSLGGFYATWVAETMDCKAVLLNPAVDPARDLIGHTGEQTVWQNPADRFIFKTEYVAELRQLESGSLAQPSQYLTLVAKGDEVLDWREMAGRYEKTQLHVLEGGDHALSSFDRHLPLVLDFLNLDQRGVR